MPMNVNAGMGEKKKTKAGLKCFTYEMKTGKHKPNPVSPELHVTSNINTVRVFS